MFQITIIEGIVTGKQWRLNGDYFFRLAHYRSPERPPKLDPANPRRHLADYVTVRVPDGRVRGMPVEFKEGTRIRVTGFIQSRDHDETLEELARRAGVEEEVLAQAPEQLRSAVHRGVFTELVAEDVFVMEQ